MYVLKKKSGRFVLHANNRLARKNGQISLFTLCVSLITMMHQTYSVNHIAIALIDRFHLRFCKYTHYPLTPFTTNTTVNCILSINKKIFLNKKAVYNRQSLSVLHDFFMSIPLRIAIPDVTLTANSSQAPSRHTRGPT